MEKLYPFLYSKDLPVENSIACSWLDFVSPGWRSRFLEACKEINNILEANQFTPNDLEILQIKEKFGSLRVYCNFKEDILPKVPQSVLIQIDGILNKLDRDTSRMCFICGAPATHLSKGYVLPYCRVCAVRENDAANLRHKTAFTMKDTYTRIDT